MNTTKQNEVKYEEYLNEQLKDEEFKAAWDELESEFLMLQALIDA